ncbi:MAG: NAD-glutamate dehydrogenase [Erythrobacter sp.]|uniref:NAD-glutamate dehydrogenase n=1 Tax=Erythrobacter sp. TaxID=1042 RepID=UPI002624F03F|nr:NAD-glutamate dehydrogenase domain-containing protein [Erythrobacter sp.]MDJ0978347.1 NAD-glutamate dehydrogenase [Erythrobacter sp.]
MSNAPTLTASSEAALRDALIDHIRASILPGETPPDDATLAETAEFLASAGHVREPGHAATLVETTTTGRRRLRIAVINDDMPFLVDSLAATITAAGLSIDALVHPLVPVERDPKGQLVAVGGERDARESMIYFETPRTDARERRELVRQLDETLRDVRAAVTDWSAMQALMEADAAALDAATGPHAQEEAELLRWLNAGMLTQLGHVTRSRKGELTDACGICRESARELLTAASYVRAFEWFERTDANGQPRTLLILKANRLSNVHRRTALDLFIVPHRDEEGGVNALSVHAGVWTSAGLATRPQDVPILRKRLAQISEDFGFAPASHTGKALIHAFTTLPHDVLVAFSVPDTKRLTTAMMSLVDRPRPRLILINSPLERHLYAFVWLPREQMSTGVRLEIQDILLEIPGAKLLDWSLEVEGGALAMIEFLFDARQVERTPLAGPIERKLEDLLRGWGEAVENALSDTEEGARAIPIALRYANAFPPSYRSHFGAQEAARDITRLRALAARAGRTADTRDARLYRLTGDEADALRLKIYHTRGQFALSDAVPALENFGFRVLTQMTTQLAEGALGTIHDFTLQAQPGARIAAMLERADEIETAIAAVLNGAAEDDPFNRLVIDTALSARETEWLRAIFRYLRQTGMGFTIFTVVDALARAPRVTRAMIDLFIARHDPAFAEDREAAVRRAEVAFRAGLTQVSAINDDRLLRLYRAVIDACLRTNAFAPAAREALAFKIDSARMPSLPKPVPWREIFVYSRRVEGIHLRAGPVARGGLRWSDRRDDFRTEILGLMKAQKVKNAVIVPTGAKGGFYPKQLPNPALDRDAWAAEGQASYEVFIRTLLSITDNIVDGAVVHPEAVRVLDGEDPYFVVAADKGTARFSDVANSIAQSRDFWLDDAFASGGSNGYDHKAMGITARGAWVSVQRHFLEMGIDVQADPVRVAGCGDMSGDVFGNGMLLSKAIKLVAAFDHRHIFLDPDPDPAQSWAERKRLFDLPRSSWEDYDTALISKGGGVYPRSAKQIDLSPQAQEMLGLEDAQAEPDALIAAILKAHVDLLWFGGIGTYIKAAHESNADVGDPANDALRVDARDVGAKVVGEGANLGATQAGRIAFALKGGRINTDFIDNSAGVDCSDNEVNIKIALASAGRAGEISTQARNTLLEEMTGEVAEIVLEDNRLQALALSIAEAGGADATASHVRLIERLEELGELDRATEGLADAETFTRRAAEGQGLTRPELAVLLSSAKLALQDAIEASGLPDAAELESNLVAMFPAPMQKRFLPHIVSHQLRRELTATDLSNRIVNRLGLVHAFELAEEEGAGLADVAAAFVVVERLFDLKTIWRALDVEPMPEAARLALFDRVAGAVGNLMSDVLRTSASRVNLAHLIGDLRPGVEELTKARGELIAQETRERANALHRSLIAKGAPDAMAERVVNLFDLDGAIGLSKLALSTGLAPTRVTQAFTEIGARLGLDWAQGTAAYMSPSDVWERHLVSGLARDFQQMRLDFLERLVRQGGNREHPLDAVAEWATRNEAGVGQFRKLIARAQTQQPIAPAVLAQVASQARNLLER